MDERLNAGEKPVEPVAALSFEGIAVTGVEGVLPSVRLEMPEGYPIGTHLRFEVEVRVANVRYEEGTGRKKGDFIRKQVFAAEGVTLTGAFLPGEEASAPVGSAAGSEGLLEPEEAVPAPVEQEERPDVFEHLVITFKSLPEDRKVAMDALLTSTPDGEDVECELPVHDDLTLTAKGVQALADEAGVNAVLVDVSDPQGDMLMDALQKAKDSGDWMPHARAMQLVAFSSAAAGS